MGPINYISQVQQPFEAAMRGYQAGNAIRGVMDEREKAEQQQAAAEAMQRDFAAAANDHTKLPSLMVKYPQLSEQLKRGWEAADSVQQRSNLQQAGQVYSAIQSGRPDIAVKTLRERAEALRNSGRTEEATFYDTLAKSGEIDPHYLATSVATMLAVAPGGDKVIESYGKLGQERRAEELQPGAVRKSTADADAAESEAKTKGVTAAFARPNAEADLVAKQAEASVAPKLAQLKVQRSQAEIRNINDQISKRAQSLDLDRARLEVDIAEKLGTLPTTKLDAAAKKTVDDAVTNASVQSQQATQLDNLAQRFSSAGGGWGSVSWLSEKIKAGVGMQDQMSMLRQEYTRVRNSLAVKMLPPGPATDKDIAMVLEGFPGANASSETIAGFLRGMAKLSRMDAAVSSAKAEWAASYNGVGAAKAPKQIAGVQVVPGMSFAQLSAQISARESAAQDLGAPARISSDADYNALPSGATFIAPDGTTRRKP